jgi:RNA polymerase sigma-70 factor (ECF subfamily)
VLVKVAKAYARTRKTRYDHQDLFHEAIARILEGKRGWPQGVGILPFLCGVMRGIAWDWRTLIYGEAPEATSASEESNAIARLDAQKFVALFADDVIAQQIVVGIMEGARGEELWEQSGLSKTEYESKRRKIRRRIEKLWLENKEHGVD